MKHSIPLLASVLLCPSLLHAEPCKKDLDVTILPRAVVAVGLTLAYQASELGKGLIVNDQPRWAGDPINFYDRFGESLRWRADALDVEADVFSDQTLWLTTAAVPLLTVAEESRAGCFWEDSLAMLEAVSATLVFTQSIKPIVKRERPFARDLSEEERAEICLSRQECADLNFSFFSGHSSMTFAVASAASVVALQRGYRSASAAYAFGLTGAALTAYLRVAAGKHYLSDVTVGAVIGLGLGYVIPTYLHPLSQKQVSSAMLVPQVTESSRGLALSGMW